MEDAPRLAVLHRPEPPRGTAGGRDASESGSKIAFAHALRGWAAASVVVSHLVVTFWHRPAAIAALTHLPVPESRPPLPAKALIALGTAVPQFAFGPFGVALFFLISGFVIPFSFRKQSRLGFLAGRVLRLWPTYAAGLTVTLLALFAGALFSGKPFPYTAGQVAVHYVLGLRDLLWFPSIDGIVWTLEIEAKFYLLCAIVAPWLASGRRRVFYLLAPLLIGTVLLLDRKYDAFVAEAGRPFMLAWVASVDSQMILYMLVGTAFHFLYRGWLGRPHAALLALGLFGLSSLAAFHGYSRLVAPMTVGSQAAAFALFATCFALRDRFRGGGLSGRLADISYPLYAVHGVASYVLMALLLTAGLPAGAVLAAALTTSLLLASAIHVAVERPTHRLATRAARALSPMRAVPVTETSGQAPDRPALAA